MRLFKLNWVTNGLRRPSATSDCGRSISSPLPGILGTALGLRSEAITENQNSALFWTKMTSSNSLPL